MPLAGERRRSHERRRTDRRGAAGRRRDDFDFATSELAASEPFFEPGWLAAGDMPQDSRLLLRQVRRMAQAQDTALSRVFRTYAAARAVIGVGLVLALGATSLLGAQKFEVLASVILLYAVQSITLWLLPRFRAAPDTVDATLAAAMRRRQWLSTIGVDVAAFLTMHWLEPSASFNYAALLVLPVLMAGVLSSRLLALGTAALVSIALLAAAWRAVGADGAVTTLMLQSGLAGLGLFIITLLAAELAGRLAREELAARGSMELARQQAQLNRLVIEEMADGVLVVDKRLRVRAANPAARALLVDEGLAPPAPFSLLERAAWGALRQQVEQALAQGDWPEAGRDVTLAHASGLSRNLRMRVRFMREQSLAGESGSQPAGAARDSGNGGDSGDSGDPAPSGGTLVVLLLEDLRTAMARLRQEKLAAMGRVSAGIAHEIRNPLAAISQANALLMEDDLTAPQARLAQITADNVERLKRLVDDVMEVAPGAPPLGRAIDAQAVSAATAAEWAQTAQLLLGPASRLQVEIGQAPLGVLFDPEHLRRVLVNLLDNALRHAGAGPGSIRLLLRAHDEAWAVLAVRSDGAPIRPEVERHLFEPFFSTRSRGSGLGLYICRELCERHGASIDYRQRPASEPLRNEFVVALRRAPLGAEPGALPLDER